jgi:HlyD family secretion protein
MKLTTLSARRLVPGQSGVALLVGIAFVAMRSGPLAPTRGTVATAMQGQITSALFGIGPVEARRSHPIDPAAATGSGAS